MHVTPEPDTSILERLLDPISQVLTPDVARKLADRRADPTVQARLEELAYKRIEGQLSSEEHAEYETYVRAIEFIAVVQAKARRLMSHGYT
jgi:hypothetical protein